jgi:hypothetical protein
MRKFVVAMIVVVGVLAFNAFGQDKVGSADAKKVDASVRNSAIQKVYQLLGGYREVGGTAVARDNVFSASDVSDAQSGPKFAADLLNKGTSLPEVAKQVAARYPRLTLMITPEKHPDFLEVERLLGSATHTSKGSNPVHTSKGVIPVDTWHSFGWFLVGVSEGKVVNISIDCSSYAQTNK